MSCPTYGDQKTEKTYLYISTRTLLGIRYSQQYIHTDAFKNFGVKLIERPVYDECKEYKYDSDAYWKCVIEMEAMTVYHPTSTCKMGRREDKSTVVDPQLK